MLPLLWTLSSAATVTPDVTFRFDPEAFRGDSTRLVVRVGLPRGWHVQSNAPLDSFLIPTTVSAEGEGLKFGTPEFPPPLEKEFPALGGKVALFEGEFDVRVPVRRENPGIKAAALRSVKVKLGYQACNDTQCLPPKTVEGRHVLTTAGPPDRTPARR
jgi:hypothetical protein